MSIDKIFVIFAPKWPKEQWRQSSIPPGVADVSRHPASSRPGLSAALCLVSVNRSLCGWKARFAECEAFVRLTIPHGIVARDSSQNFQKSFSFSERLLDLFRTRIRP